MEQRLREASQNGVRVLIVRAGDFFGPRAGNNWFAQGLIQPGKSVGTIRYPGKRGLGHQWAYLPDVAETMVRLLERPGDRPTYETFHMDGQWDEDGTQMVAAIRKAVGRDVPARAFPWWLVTAASPIVPLFREMREMHYLWRKPLRLSNAHLVEAIGPEPHTPLDHAVRETLVGLGCLSPATVKSPRRPEPSQSRARA
jgi:nucleoside-diphosphate-sugar epimerase